MLGDMLDVAIGVVGQVLHDRFEHDRELYNDASVAL
jgi:hypothetical protein